MLATAKVNLIVLTIRDKGAAVIKWYTLDTQENRVHVDMQAADARAKGRTTRITYEVQ